MTFRLSILLLPMLLAATAVLAAKVAVATTEPSLLVIGGAHTTWDANDPMDNVDIISLASKKHRAGASAPANVSMIGSVLVDNKTIYTLGGQWQKYFWAYDVPTNTWTKMPDFPETIGGSVLLEVNRTMIALGGDNSPRSMSRQVYAYDLNDGENGQWLPISSRPRRNDFPCAITVDGVVYFLDYDQFHKSEDIGLTWTPIKSPVVTTELCACVAIGDLILVAGGKNYPDGDLAAFQAYNITSDSWSLLPHMPKARVGAAAVALPAGDHSNVLVCGGVTNGIAVASCIMYDTVAQVWNKKSKFALDQPRSVFGFFVAETPTF